MPNRLEPELLQLFRHGYDLRAFARDLAAGVVVGIVALPLAIAFGIASGVTPEQGIFTAIVAGFLISALGGSRVQIGGPTGAFVVLVATVVHRHGVDGLAVATMMAGAMLVLLGLLRLGSVIRHVPFPVTLGFTAGIAVLIATGQLATALGLQGHSGEGVFHTISGIAGELGATSPAAFGVAALSVLIMVLWPRLDHRVPAPLVAVVLAALGVALLDLPVVTIGERFGAMPRSLPLPQLPGFEFDRLRELFPAAVSIALLGAVESLLSAVVADGMIGSRHRSNAELVGQGIANLAAPLFGGIPATGAIARTATNVKSGGRTPVAGMVHALFLLLVLALLAPTVASIPLPALAGILLVVAYHMSEWRAVRQLLSHRNGDAGVLLVTFFATVFFDVVLALQLGMMLAALLFMRRIVRLSDVRVVEDPFADEPERSTSTPTGPVPEDVEVYEVQGALFFGATTRFVDALHRIEKAPRVLILRMRQVVAIDSTGLNALGSVVESARRDGTLLLLSGVQPVVREAMRRSGLLAKLGEDRLMSNIAEALARAAATKNAPATSATGALPFTD